MNRLLACSLFLWPALAVGQPVVFPEPREMKATGASFALDERTVIALPANATPADRHTARVLQSDLADRYGVAVRVVPAVSLRPGVRAIVIGAAANPAIAPRAAKLGLKTTAPEGYALDVSPGLVLVAGTDVPGAFYGMQTLRQLITDGKTIPGVRIRDWPASSFRGVKLYLPGRENIGFFKRFVRDFMALYKFNHLVMEMNAAMRLDRHPELNAGWVEYARDMNFSRRERPLGANGAFQDSSHHDTGDGLVLEKEEVAGLVRWARQNHIEVMPELASLTHSYHLLTRHRDLAENPGSEWPDTYCPSNPAVYPLLFDVFDEYIEVMKPKMIHIGHDEWRMPRDVCERCKGKPFGDLFGQDVAKIHKYLAAKGVKTAMWGDHLIPRLRGEDGHARKTATGYEYRTPGGLTPAQVKKWIPTDILIFNWFWNDTQPGQGEVNDKDLEAWGFSQVYGNMEPGIPNYAQRVKRRGVLGGAPSSWAATTEFNIGKDLLYQYAGTAEMLWTGATPDQPALLSRVQRLMPLMRRNLSGAALPSTDIDVIAPLALSGGSAAAARQAMPGIEWKSGTAEYGRVSFTLAEPVVVGVEGRKPAPWPRESQAIAVNEDPTSIVFLHATARRAGNTMAYRQIYNFTDTAELLGWYEVLYEDGYTVNVPVRYGVNIVEWNRGAAGGRGGRSYCYGGAPVSVGQGATFYAYEWTNPRFGKAIREIRLKGASGFGFTPETKAGENGIILAAVSVVKKRPFPDPVSASSAPAR